MKKEERNIIYSRLQIYPDYMRLEYKRLDDNKIIKIMSSRFNKPYEFLNNNLHIDHPKNMIIVIDEIHLSSALKYFINALWSRNILYNISLDKFKYLKTLYISGDNFKNIDLSKNSKLQDIYISKFKGNLYLPDNKGNINTEENIIQSSSLHFKDC